MSCRQHGSLKPQRAGAEVRSDGGGANSVSWEIVGGWCVGLESQAVGIEA